MAELKHVGRLISNKRKCIVAYRVVPHAPDYCLVVHTESLDAEQHDSLMKLVESNTGQTAYELAEAMSRTRLPDGRNMLQAFHTQGKLSKTLTKDVEMIPNQQTTINLAELNRMIADQRGVTVEDLALGITNKKQKAEMQSDTPADTVKDELAELKNEFDGDEPLTDVKLAAQYRSQADAMYKEAKRLRDEANELDPPQKKAPAKSTSATKDKKKETSG